MFTHCPSGCDQPMVLRVGHLFLLVELAAFVIYQVEEFVLEYLLFWQQERALLWRGGGWGLNWEAQNTWRLLRLREGCGARGMGVGGAHFPQLTNKAGRQPLRTHAEPLCEGGL